MDLYGVWDGIARIDARLGLSSIVPDRSGRVVMYHSVGDSNLFGNISQSRFRKDLENLQSRYEVADLPAVLESQKKRIALTFDDGYSNFYTQAYPLLREYDLPATVFVIAGSIDANDSESLVDSTLTMDASQIEALVGDDLITIGNHTMTHPRLSAVRDESRLRREILGAKEVLEHRFGISVERFCYPHGDVSSASRATVRDTHESSFAIGVNRWWFNSGSTHEIPRLRGHDPHHILRWKLTDASSYLMKSAIRTGLARSAVSGTPT